MKVNIKISDEKLILEKKGKKENEQIILNIQSTEIYNILAFF